MGPPDDSRLECPTSGVLLGAAVKALQLDNEDVGGPASRHLGSHASLGRTARRYFDGTPIPEPTCRQLCVWVAQALIHSGLVDGMTLPDDEPHKPPPLEEFLSKSLFQWLSWWDFTFHRAASGWPHLPHSLTAYVMGRQLVIDLAVRLTALMQLSGFADPSAVELAIEYQSPGRAVIDKLMQSAGQSLTRDVLADRVGVERTTVDDWIDQTAVPKDDKLRRLARLFSNAERQEPSVLRWLRVQYAAIRLKRLLQPHLGEGWTAELLFALVEMIRWTLDVHSQSRLAKDQFMMGQVMTTTAGVAMPGNYWLLNAWIKFAKLSEPPARDWIDDIVSAQSGKIAERLEMCFSIIGDWPATVALNNAAMDASGDMKWASMATDDRRLYHVASALLFMSPTAHTEAMKGDSTGKFKTDWDTQIAWNLMQAGRHASAVPLLASLVVERPDDAQLRCWFGEALWRSDLKRCGDGMAQLKEAVRLRPSWDFPIAESARIFLACGLNEEAAARIRAAPAEVVSASNDCQFALALALMRSGRYPEALAASERAFELDPRHADAWDLAAECAFRLGDKVKGRRYAKAARHLGRSLSFRKWVNRTG